MNVITTLGTDHEFPSEKGETEVVSGKRITKYLYKCFSFFTKIFSKAAIKEWDRGTDYNKESTTSKCQVKHCFIVYSITRFILKISIVDNFLVSSILGRTGE